MSLEETLKRLELEREEADRRYNDALTALDRTIGVSADLPAFRGGFDETELERLNEAWNIGAAGTGTGGLRGRLAALVWRTVGPILQRQQSFNSWLVDHLNRNLAAAREARHAQEEVSTALRERLARLAEFQSRLVSYLQQITAYVDTRDRAAGGQALILNRAISGVAESVDKRAESLAAREQRLDTRVVALAAADEELRAALTVVQQASLALKRELTHMTAAPAAAGAGTAVTSAPPPADRAFAPALDAYKYLAFEDQFRGSRETIRERLATYVPFFRGKDVVLDVGCGRGEFLELLSAEGIRARGIDLNHEMVESCRARGLDVEEADAVAYLEALPDASLGGVFAAQVVEHLRAPYLLAFLELAFHKLRPGGSLVLETLNPACWVAFFESYIRDITHVWPLHPETLRFLVVASGFSRTDVEYRSPVPARDKLRHVELPANVDGALAELAETVNVNVDQLNARLFSHLDYAIVGTR
jgi:SAM-dependent methyltransferase